MSYINPGLILLGLIFTSSVYAKPLITDACKASLFQKMVTKQIGFENSSSTDIDDKVMRGQMYLSSPTQLQFVSTQPTPESAKFLRVRHLDSRNNEFYFDYSLESVRESEDQAYVYLILDLEMNDFKSHSKVLEVSQIYRVSQDCKLQLYSYSYEDITKHSDSSYGVEYTSHMYLTGQSKRDYRVFEKPNDTNKVYFFNFYNIKNVLKQNPNLQGYSLSYERGFIPFELRNYKKSISRKFDWKSFASKSYEILSVDAHEMSEKMSLTLNSFNQDYEAQISTLKQKTVSFIEGIFIFSNMLVEEDTKSILLQQNYDTRADVVTLQVTKSSQISYPNIKNYWSIQQLSQNTYTFEEYRGQIQKTWQSGESELANSRSLDFLNPEIQAIKYLILAQNPQTVQEKVQLILEQINDRIQYDKKALKELSIMSGLTPAETLSRGKGVCGDFSKLFVALARSMGIPSILVTGITITEGKSDLGHVWVEYEVQPGYWVPVEPQSRSVRINNIRNYLPFYRDISSESGKINVEEIKRSVMSYNITEVTGTEVK